MLKQVVVLPALYLLGGCQLVFSLSAPSPQDAADAADAPPDSFSFPVGVTRLAEAPEAHGLHLNQNYVYYTTSIFDSQLNQVGRVRLSDGGVEILAANELAVPNIFTKDDNAIYWTTWDPGSLRAIDKTTVLGPQTIVTTPGAAFFALALDDNGTLLAPSVNGGRFYELPEPPNQMLAMPSWSVAVSDVAKFSTVTTAVVRDGQLFWTNQEENAAGGVYSANLADLEAGTATITTLALDSERAWGLVVTADDIVYSRSGPISGGTGKSALVRIPRQGGPPVELVHGRTRIRGLAVDGGAVYYAEHVGGGGIWKVSLDGGSAEMIAPSRLPLLVAVDDTAIFWTSLDPVDGGLYRVAK